MGLLTEFLDLGTVLVDVQMKRLQQGLVRWFAGVFLLIASLLFLLTGFVLVVGGFYELLKNATSPAGGAFIEGGAILVWAFILIWIAKPMSR